MITLCGKAGNCVAYLILIIPLQLLFLIYVLQLADDLAILSALTGQPDAEDELLYCIPVCAPYSALSNYKLVYNYIFLIRSTA